MCVCVCVHVSENIFLNEGISFRVSRRKQAYRNWKQETACIHLFQYIFTKLNVCVYSKYIFYVHVFPAYFTILEFLHPNVF